MNEQQFKEFCAGLTRRELIKPLLEVEQSYNLVLSAATKFRQEKEELEKAQKAYDYVKGQYESRDSQKRFARILSVVFVALAIWLFYRGSNAWLFGKFIYPILAIISLGSAIALLFYKPTTADKVQKEADNVASLKQKVDELDANLNQLVAQHRDNLLIHRWICPMKCLEPQYLRIFVSYFEDCRADSLKEAYKLFEEMLHREQMEANSNAQLAASLSAQNAAIAARDAALDASTAANQAKISADWAYFHSKFD